MLALAASTLTLSSEEASFDPASPAAGREACMGRVPSCSCSLENTDSEWGAPSSPAKAVPSIRRDFLEQGQLLLQMQLFLFPMGWDLA